VILPVPSTPAIAAKPSVPPSSDASTASGESKFSELVEQMVGDSAPAGGVKRLPIKGSAPAAAEALPELPTTALPIMVKMPDDAAASTLPSGPRRADARKGAEPDKGHSQTPPLAVDQPVLQIPLPLKSQLLSPVNGGADELKSLAFAANDAPTRITLESKPMLEVKIHLDASAAPATPQVSAPPAAENPAPARADASAAVQPAAAETAASSQSQQNAQNQRRGTSDSPPQQPATLRAADNSAKTAAATEHPPGGPADSRPEATPAPIPTTNAASAPAPVVQPPPTVPLNTLRHLPPAPTAPPQAAPPDPPKPQQPLRSMALEFTPDGATDIKVRLSERGGDVHISLHGTDPALAGRVREGVSDLVGSLSKAGYDAEAWTPSQGRQQEREQEPRQPGHQQKNNSDSGEFSSILQQPSQENL
jgi:hypothetical protein